MGGSAGARVSAGVGLVQDKVVYTDRMARLAGIESGECPAGENDEKVGSLERVTELEQDDGSVWRGCFSTSASASVSLSRTREQQQRNRVDVTRLFLVSSGHAGRTPTHLIIRTPSRPVLHPPMNSKKSAGRIQAGTARIAIRLPSSPSALSPLHGSGSDVRRAAELSPNGCASREEMSAGGGACRKRWTTPRPTWVTPEATDDSSGFGPGKWARRGWRERESGDEVASDGDLDFLRVVGVAWEWD
jgi:hypothetical protein